jgi:uncharacterized protein
MKRIAFFVGIATLLGVAFSCSKSGSKSGGTTTTGNSDSVLVTIGNQIILPAYQHLALAANALDSAIIDFQGGPTATKLANVQALFKTAYLDWEAASAFDYFGPASTAQPVLATINVFPTNSNLIDSNVRVGNNNIMSFANTAARGYPALDYLLFGSGANTLTLYTTDAAAGNRLAYLSAVAADINTETIAVNNGWAAGGGGYINTFVNGSGNSVSSSLGLLINSMDEDFEILKNDRLGIPLGLIPVGVVSPVLPKEVEAYYSGISVQLALAQLKAIQSVYVELSTYLVNAKATYNGGMLSDTIRVAFATGVTDLQAVPDPLAQTLQTSTAGAQTAFAQMQKLVALLKTDMPSALGVLITYGDNDGD